MSSGASLQIYRHEGALAALGSNARGHWSERVGLVVRLSLGDAVGFGECSPLPGFSEATLHECLTDLSHFEIQDALRRMPPLDAPFELSALTQLAGGLRTGEARFALESAYLSAWSTRNKRSVAELIGAAPSAKRPLAAVVDPLAPDALEQASALIDTGYGTLKLKVGRDIAREAQLAHRLCQRGRVTLRLDLNQSLAPERLESSLTKFPLERVAFVEEPTPGEALPGLWQRFEDFPMLALDESLSGVTPLSLPQVMAQTGARVVVIKPMRFGVAASLALAQTARACDFGIVFSHQMGGPLELNMAACLALAVGDDFLAAGLAPHPGLATWAQPALLWHDRVEIVGRPAALGLGGPALDSLERVVS